MHEQWSGEQFIDTQEYSLAEPTSDDFVLLGEVEFHRIERNRAVAEWTQGFLAVNEQYGRVGVERLLGLLREKGSKLTEVDCQSALADIPPRSELKAAMTAFLEKRGVATRDENGTLIIDLEEFKLIKASLIKEAGEFTYRSNKTKERTPRFAPYYNGQTRLLFYEALRDEKVISHDDYQAGVRTPKSLVYAPASSAEAFDETTIREADFYLGLWDFPGNPPVDENGNLYYPTDLGAVDWAAAQLACKLYNKKMGAAFRDEAGVLQVKLPEQEAREPFSASKFTTDFKLGTSTKQGGDKVSDNFTQFLMSEGQALVNSDLLRLEDVGTRSSLDVWETHRFFRRNAVIYNEENRKALISFAGRDYKLPVSFGRGPAYTLYQISSETLGLAAVGADGKEQLEYTFPIQSKDTAQKKDVKVSEIELKPYVREIKNGQAHEAVEFQELLDLSAEFSARAGINLATLKFSEQSSAVAGLRNAFQTNPEKVVNFVKTHGTEGLRAFSALQVDPLAADAIFAIDQVYPPAQAGLIFEKFNSLLDQADVVRADVAKACVETKHFKGEVTQTGLLGEFMKRAARLLSDYAVRQKSDNASTLLRELDSIRNDVMLFAAIFKTYIKEHGPRSALEISGVDYRMIPGLTLDRADKNEMLALSWQNYSKTEPDVPKALESLLKDRERLKKVDFYTLKHTDADEDEPSLVAFLRVEKQSPEQVYVGSFNVRKEAQQAGIAEQMIAQTVIDLAKTYDVSAIMNQELAAGSLYVEQAGAVATGYERYPASERGPMGHFEILVAKNKLPSQLAGIPRTELMQQYEQTAKGIDPLSRVGEPVILTVFDTITEKQKIADVADELLNHQGYRMTRYLNLDGAGIRRLYGFEKISTAPAAKASRT